MWTPSGRKNASGIEPRFLGLAALLFSAAWLLSAGSCGENAGKWQSGYAGMSYCQDMAGTYHFQVFVPPWKYRREYECTDGDFRNCNHWEPTGRYVFVVTDVPYVSYDSEIVDLLRVEFLHGKDARRAVDELLSQIHSDDKAEVLLSRDGEESRQLDNLMGLGGMEVFWTQIREHDGESFEWYRRDAFFDVVNGSFHLEMFSIDSMDRPDFDALVDTFSDGPAPDEGASCRCMDDLADPPTPCVQ